VVGGTSGIGLAIALRLATAKANVTIMGRNKAAADNIVVTLKERNPGGTHAFIPVEASLMASVKEACGKFKDSHSKLDILVTCQGGAPSLKGRVETPEGLDTKMATHYFGRVLFWRQLAPLLEESPSPRILTVHGFNDDYKEYKSDFDVKSHYSMVNVANACGMYMDIAVDCMSKEHPKLFLVHAAPGVVKTGWGKDWPWYWRLPIRALQGMIATSPESCAEFMCEPLLRKQVTPGSFLLMGPHDNVLKKSKLHDEARDFVWEQTVNVLGNF